MKLNERCYRKGCLLHSMKRWPEHAVLPTALQRNSSLKEEEMIRSGLTLWWWQWDFPQSLHRVEPGLSSTGGTDGTTDTLPQPRELIKTLNFSADK